MTSYNHIGECQVCGRQHRVNDSDGMVARHKPDVQWAEPPEWCQGSGQPPYEVACTTLAEYRSALLQQIAGLALEHLNTAVSENVDPHGRSWVRITAQPSAFNPRGGVQWILARILQTEAGVVQACDAVGNLHPLPAFKTVRAARKAMLDYRLATLDTWHMAATQRAEWCRLRMEQWEPRPLQRAVGNKVRHTLAQFAPAHNDR